jgi:hypothetical protein
METLSARKDDLPSSSQTRRSPLESACSHQDEDPGFNTVFRLYLHSESGKLRLEESISNFKLLKPFSDRYMNNLLEDSISLTKRAKSNAFDSPTQFIPGSQCFNLRYSLTRPLSFLDTMKRKKNKTDFLKNFAFAFEELMEFEGRFRHFIYDHKIYEGLQHQTDLTVLTARKFRTALTPHFAQSFSQKCPVFKAKSAKARRILMDKYNLQATDSQILRLMTLCDGEDIFWYLLSYQREVVMDFFTSSK